MDLSEIPDGPFVRHPWEVARAQFFVKTTGRYGLADAPLDVLDVGAGDGYLAGRLLSSVPASSRVTCFDPYYTQAFLEHAPPMPENLTFTNVRPAQAFDLLLLLDVLEHVPDDLTLLTDLAGRNLRAGGHVLISVPAFMALFTRHDISLGHYRRYTANMLRTVVGGAGLRVVAGGGLFHSLLPARALQKCGEWMRGTRSVPSVQGHPDGETDVGRWQGGAAVTTAVTGVLRIDNAVSGWAARSGLDIPGLSTWVLARKV